jgi:hypothetical protein
VKLILELPFPLCKPRSGAIPGLYKHAGGTRQSARFKLSDNLSWYQSLHLDPIQSNPHHVNTLFHRRHQSSGRPRGLRETDEGQLHAMAHASSRSCEERARMEGFLTGAAKAPTAMIKETKDGNEAEVSNPAYEEWVAMDQQVLGYLISNMSSSIQYQLTACKTAAETWRAIEGMFYSMTRARAVNTRIVLATMKKGNFSMVEYVGKMRSLIDEITSTGKTIDDDELVSYILAGLDYDYNPIVTSLTARIEPLSVGEAYSQLLAFEQRMDLLQPDGRSSVNSASRGRGTPRGRGGGGRSRGGSSGRGHGRSSGPPRQQHGAPNSNTRGPDNRPRQGRSYVEIRGCICTHENLEI